MKKRIWVSIGVIVLLLILGYIGVSDSISYHEKNAGQEQPNIIGVTIGKAAPSFTLKNPEGHSIQVMPTGKPYVLNFWTTWCPPCKQELPEVESFVQKYGNEVLFYAINLQESPEQVTSFFYQQGYHIPVLLDQSGTIAQQFRINAIPTTIVVDSKGIIRYRKTGGVTFSELESVMKGL